MKKILDKVKTKVLEGINLLALKLTARSANLTGYIFRMKNRTKLRR